MRLRIAIRVKDVDFILEYKVFFLQLLNVRHFEFYGIVLHCEGRKMKIDINIVPNVKVRAIYFRFVHATSNNNNITTKQMPLLMCNSSYKTVSSRLARNSHLFMVVGV